MYIFTNACVFVVCCDCSVFAPCHGTGQGTGGTSATGLPVTPSVKPRRDSTSLPLEGTAQHFTPPTRRGPWEPSTQGEVQPSSHPHCWRLASLTRGQNNPSAANLTVERADARRGTVSPAHRRLRARWMGREENSCAARVERV